jgi:hypothetical protein
MTYAYTTTAHHFGQCEVNSVHRKWTASDEVEICFERRESGGKRGDEITLHISKSHAKRLCKGLLNIIDNDAGFHKELEDMMKVQRMPE